MKESDTALQPVPRERERCGAPIEAEVESDFPNARDERYSIYGSRCNEWEDGPYSSDH